MYIGTYVYIYKYVYIYIHIYICKTRSPEVMLGVFSLLSVEIVMWTCVCVGGCVCGRLAVFLPRF